MSHYAPDPTDPSGVPSAAGPGLAYGTDSAFGPGAAVAPPRRRRGAVILISAMVAVILLAAGGTVAYLRLRPAAGTAVNAAASPTTSPTPVITVPPTTPPFSGDLRTLLLPKPAGAKAQANDHESTNGNVSIEQAAEVFGGSDMVSQLRELGFQRGALTGWSDSKGYLVFIELYQFETPARTAEFVISTQAGFAEAKELESTAYFDGIQGGRWFVDKKAPGTKQQMYSTLR